MNHELPVHSAVSKKPTAVLVVAVSALLGAGLGYSVIRWLMTNHDKLLKLDSPSLVLLSLIPVVFFVISIHELGHVLGGWCSGHRFQMLIVGPLKITRGPQRLSWEFNRNLAMAGGLALCLPTKLDHFRRRRFWLAAGGPSASVLLASFCWFFAGFASAFSSFLGDLLVVTALFSALIALVTLAPHSWGGFPSDGFQMLGLVRGKASAEKIGLVSLLYNLSMSGTRPRDWPRELIERAATIPAGQPSFDAATELFAYSHYLDRGEIELAESHLEKSLSQFDRLPHNVRQGFALEAAYFAAVHRRDQALANAWFERGWGGIVEPVARSRVEAAMLLLNGRLQEAQVKLDLARKQLQDSTDRGGALAEADMLNHMERRLKARA